MEPTTSEMIVQATAALLATAITVFVIPWLRKQGKVADGKISEQARERLYPALQYAIAYGRAALSSDDQAKLETSDKLKNIVVSTASSYIKSKFPETLEELGITEDALSQLLRARLQGALDYLKIPPAK